MLCNSVIQQADHPKLIFTDNRDDEVVCLDVTLMKLRGLHCDSQLDIHERFIDIRRREGYLPLENLLVWVSGYVEIVDLCNGWNW